MLLESAPIESVSVGEEDEAPAGCWTLVRRAAAGEPGMRTEFAGRYLRVVRSYLASRWRRTACIEHLDDGVQEVFFECFRRDGALSRVESDSNGDFLTYLYGIVRNVARRIEERSWKRFCEGAGDELLEGAHPLDHETPVRIHERSWARRMIQEACDLHQSRASEAGQRSLRRVELLGLRCSEGLPIREIARRWNVDAAFLHHEYARARREFKVALMDVVVPRRSGAADDVEQECRQLTALL